MVFTMGSKSDELRELSIRRISTDKKMCTLRDALRLFDNAENPFALASAFGLNLANLETPSVASCKYLFLDEIKRLENEYEVVCSMIDLTVRIEQLETARSLKEERIEGLKRKLAAIL
jgi:hypothetical protein